MFNANYIATTESELDDLFAQLKGIILEQKMSVVTGINGSWEIKPGKPTKKTPTPPVTFRQDVWLDRRLFEESEIYKTLNTSGKLMLMLMPTDLIKTTDKEDK